MRTRRVSLSVASTPAARALCSMNTAHASGSFTRKLWMRVTTRALSFYSSFARFVTTSFQKSGYKNLT